MVDVPPPPPSAGTNVICPPGIGLSLKYTVPFRVPFFPPQPVAGRNTNRARRTTAARLFAQDIVHMIGPLGAFAKIRKVSLTGPRCRETLAFCEAEGAGRAGAYPGPICSFPLARHKLPVGSEDVPCARRQGSPPGAGADVRADEADAAGAPADREATRVPGAGDMAVRAMCPEAAVEAAERRGLEQGRRSRWLKRIGVFIRGDRRAPVRPVVEAVVRGPG